MSTRGIISAIIAPLVLLGVASAALAQPESGGFALQLQAEHDRARDEAGVPRLAWSSKLARDAQSWAEKLAREGAMRHAPRAESGGAGENLWMGSAGDYEPERMVQAFVEEKRHFVRAAFPGVSRTGKWQDVAHYTQVVWRGTREVGCGIARGGQDDFLVCRYWPAGNSFGQVPF